MEMVDANLVDCRIPQVSGVQGFLELCNVFLHEPAPHQAQRLALGTPVGVAVVVVGEPVPVAGMVQRHSSGRLRHRRPLATVSAFLQRGCRVVAGIGQGQSGRFR